jgi:hypothetical protein
MRGHPAALDPDKLAAECEFRATRRSGPGGQNRNKVETAVILTHRPTGISAEAAERRSQGQNRQQALFRLRVRLALDIRTPAGTAPSSLWTSRIRGGRIVVNPDHDDFPALLAEALDVLGSLDDDVKEAAARLGCSTTQFVKLLALEPLALGRLNERREARHPRIVRE